MSFMDITKYEYFIHIYVFPLNTNVCLLVDGCDWALDATMSGGFSCAMCAHWPLIKCYSASFVFISNGKFWSAPFLHC